MSPEFPTELWQDYMIKVICIKSFIEEPTALFIHNNNSFFEEGKIYGHWTNFGGLNYFVMDHYGKIYPFEGLVKNEDRYYFWDYFMNIEDYRNSQIIKIL